MFFSSFIKFYVTYILVCNHRKSNQNQVNISTLLVPYQTYHSHLKCVLNSSNNNVSTISKFVNEVSDYHVLIFLFQVAISHTSYEVDLSKGG